SPNKRPKTCHFYPENVIPRTRCLDGVNWKVERPSVAAPSPSPEMVSKLSVRASARDLLLGTPTTSQRERSIFTSLVGMAISRAHAMTRLFRLVSSFRTANHVQASSTLSIKLFGTPS
ncbi:hypothetical protein P5673_012483, partial [Acropora cervicornis]